MEAVERPGSGQPGQRLTKTMNSLEQSESANRRSPASGCYAHPTTIQEFEAVYRKEYEQELESCDKWIKWCERENDTHGMNFHQGMRAAHVFNNIKMEQLLRVLKQEAPNAASGHNDQALPPATK